VESKQAVMVADVHKDPRYLPTFGSTNSEIVVPVMTESGKVVGLIDVESEKLDAFTENDRDFLEHAAFLIARALK
jgi:putative methionine-R-sulfoxide reductase with GAF domain